MRKQLASLAVILCVAVLTSTCDQQTKKTKPANATSVVKQVNSNAQDKQVQSKATGVPVEGVQCQPKPLYIYEDISDSTDTAHRQISKAQIIKGFRQTPIPCLTKIYLIRFGSKPLWSALAEEFELPNRPNCPPVDYNELDPKVRNFEPHREDLRKRHAERCRVAEVNFMKVYEIQLARFEQVFLHEPLKGVPCPCTSFADVIKRIKLDEAKVAMLVTDLVQDCGEQVEEFDAPLVIIQVKSATSTEMPETLAAKAQSIFSQAWIIPGVHADRAMNQLTLLTTSGIEQARN